MKEDNKHYKFINSQTGNTIYYHCIKGGKSEDEKKAELEKIKAHVAMQNGMYVDIVYWEEIKDGK